MFFRDEVMVKDAAAGFFVALIDGRIFYFEKDAIRTETEGEIELFANRTYEIRLRQAPAPSKGIQCLATKVSDMPVKTVVTGIFKKGILSYERIREDSFVYQAVQKVRSGIVTPDLSIVGKVN